MKYMEWGGWIDLYILLPLQIIVMAAFLGWCAYSLYVLALVGALLLQ